MIVQVVYPILDFIGTPLLVTALIFLLALETWRPLRRRLQSRLKRLMTNAAIGATAMVTVRLALIPVVVLAAKWSHDHQFGLVYLLPLPSPARAVIAFLLLDYSMYAWHWLNHQVPLLWRFHNVHHTDLDLDVTTAARFHFGEMLLSVLVRSLQIVLIGAGPVLALVYEIALEASTQFHHSNWRLPYRLERLLSMLVVTPRMHGIHHSIVRRETNSNFSNMLVVWDRLHATLRLNVRQDEITIGVPSYRDAGELTFAKLLAMPFRGQRTPWPEGAPLMRQEEQPLPPTELAR